MARFFNIAGPCVPGEHYMLPARERCADLIDLIERKQFFVIHAARQSGKTTLLQDLAGDLEARGEYIALYCSLESVQPFPEPERGIPAIVATIQTAMTYHPLLKGRRFTPAESPQEINTIIRNGFTDLCLALDRPLVVLFDEADCLSAGTMIAFLRQLRDGYINRGRIPFIHSLALVGMRNIRDYKGRLREGGQTLGSASPFNIAAKSLTLRNFTPEEVAALYGQHTADTGQVFPAEASARAWDWTRGQPWLVNALAHEVVDEILAGDPARPIHPGHIDEAAEILIRRRDTHLDSLLERLKEERVRRIIEPMLVGAEHAINRASDDYEYVRDLGLIREGKGVLRPANPIYGEVITRTLNLNAQEDLPVEFIHHWMDDNAIFMDDLLAAFQQFWRENSESWTQVIMYHEAGPQLVLMAFLQRVVNGGARILREFASGSRRIDLCVLYRQHRYPLELKVWRDGDRRDVRAEGLEQLARYMDTLGAAEGWLVIFDEREGRSWAERIYRADEPLPGGKMIHIIGA